MSTCPKCGADYKEGASFCSVCGEALTKTCVKCKATMDVHDRFCKTCGFDNSEENIASFNSDQIMDKAIKNCHAKSIVKRIIIIFIVILVIILGYIIVANSVYKSHLHGYSLVNALVTINGEKQNEYYIFTELKQETLYVYVLDGDYKVLNKRHPVAEACYQSLVNRGKSNLPNNRDSYILSTHINFNIIPVLENDFLMDKAIESIKNSDYEDFYAIPLVDRKILDLRNQSLSFGRDGYGKVLLGKPQEHGDYEVHPVDKLTLIKIGR